MVAWSGIVPRRLGRFVSPDVPLTMSFANAARTLLASVAVLPLVVSAAPDFERDVQPILAAHCIKCHGPQKQKGGYRLDARSVALNGGDGSAPNIVPGDAAASPLVRYISGADPDLRMPPEGEAPLSAAEVAVIRDWIGEHCARRSAGLVVAETNRPPSAASGRFASDRCIRPRHARGP